MTNDLHEPPRRGPRPPRPRPKHTEESAVALIKGAGYEPLEPYPGAVKSPWRVRCTTPTCLAERIVRLEELSRPNGRLCGHRDTTGPKVADLPIGDLVREYNGGATLRALAQKYGTSYSTVHIALDGRVSFRSTGRRKKKT